MELIYTLLLIILMLINILVATLSNGYALAAIIGLLNITIAITSMSSAIFEAIYFSPYLQLMVIIVAIYTMYTSFRGSKHQ